MMAGFKYMKTMGKSICRFRRFTKLINSTVRRHSFSTFIRNRVRSLREGLEARRSRSEASDMREEEWSGSATPESPTRAEARGTPERSFFEYCTGYGNLLYFY